MNEAAPLKYGEPVYEGDGMPLDLSRIGSGSNRPLLEPRAIYAALPGRPWPYLRQEQGEVLERWFKRRDGRDIVIKQNTGGGKTVVEVDDPLVIQRSTLLASTPTAAAKPVCVNSAASSALRKRWLGMAQSIAGTSPSVLWTG